MNNKANKIIYSILALIVYIGIMVGFGHILPTDTIDEVFGRWSGIHKYEMSSLSLTIE